MNREAMSDAEFITAMQQGLPPLPEYPQKSQLPPTPPKHESFEECMRRTERGILLIDLALYAGFLLLGVLAGTVIGGAL